MPAIDVHNHWAPPLYVETIERHVAAGELDPVVGVAIAHPSLRQLAGRVTEMNAAGIERAVLSLPTPGVQIGTNAESIELAASVNDEMIGAVEENRERFCALAALPFPDSSACVAELERIKSRDQIRGIGVMTNSQSWCLDDPSFEEVYARAAELGLPLVLHPQLEELPSAYGDYSLAASLAPMVSSSLGTLRLVLSGMLDRVPELVVIVPHLGGTLLYLAQRIVDQSLAAVAQHDFLHYCRTRLYFDTCSYHPPAMRCALDTVGADRLLCGSDYPFRGAMARAVVDVVDFGLSDDEREAILSNTARRWFA